jgi:hypothetical protein
MTTSIGTIAQMALRRLGVRIVPLDDSPTLTEMVSFDTVAIGALIELGVIASDETPIPSDQALMLDKVASVHAALDAQGIVWWPSGSVPRAFVEEYTKLTAAMAGSSFGKAIDPAIVALLEARVRKGAMVLSADDNAQQAVQAVHDDLVMRGIARWTSLDIPTALGDPYVVLTSANLDPLFGLQTTDANDVRDAMVAIYRYVALPSSGETVSVAYF